MKKKKNNKLLLYRFIISKHKEDDILVLTDVNNSEIIIELENKLIQNKISNIYDSDYYNNDNTFSLEIIEILENKFPKNKFILVNKDTEEKIYIEI
jgi:hypothetical protein